MWKDARQNRQRLDFGNATMLYLSLQQSSPRGLAECGRSRILKKVKATAVTTGTA